eukprot:g11233.t1
MFHGHRATTKRRVDKIFAKHRVRLDMYGADESCKASSTKNDCDHKCHFETYTTDNNGEHQDPKDNKEYFRKKVSFEPEVKVYENCCVAQETKPLLKQHAESCNVEELFPSAKQQATKVPANWIFKHEKSLNEALRARRHDPSNLRKERPRALDMDIDLLRLACIDTIPVQFHQYKYIKRPPTFEEKRKYFCEYVSEFELYRLMIFPALLPSGRSDVIELGQWLENTVERYLYFVRSQQMQRLEKREEKLPESSGVFHSKKMVLNTLKSLFRLAGLEIARQEKIICSHRGLLLENVIENMTMINANLQKIEEEFRSARTYDIEKLRIDRIELQKKVSFLQDEVDSIFNHLQKFRRNKGNDQAVDISVRDGSL